MKGYNSWTAVAGFFDGDGSVDVDPREYTLHWVISFSDNWLEQIEQVREFLVSRGIKVGRARKAGIGGWTCGVTEISSLMKMASEMLQSGGIYKKKRELQLLIDYYQDKVTGTEVIDAFNDEVKTGKRVGKIKTVSMPYTHTAGFTRARYASRFEKRALTRAQSARLINEYLTKHVTGKSLARKCDISESTVSRILKEAGVRRYKPNSSKASF